MSWSVFTACSLWWRNFILQYLSLILTFQFTCFAFWKLFYSSNISFHQLNFSVSIYTNCFCVSLFFLSLRNTPTLWRPEYAGYMVEGTPGSPFGGLMAHLNLVEANMKLRYRFFINLLRVYEHLNKLMSLKIV